MTEASSLFRRLAWAEDASHYTLVPSAVTIAQDEATVQAVLAASGEHSVTFRGGGTSLSGQASTSGHLIDTRRGFRAVEVMEDGARVRAGAGAVLRSVNARLLRHRRRLGPDPASEIACTIGGVLANNSSGMACGTQENAYATVESVRGVLADGTLFDTADPDITQQTLQAQPRLWNGLARIRDELRANPVLIREIERQFAIKNTMGYSLNAFLDEEDPVRILTRLLIGNEGTLAFISSAVLRTVPLRPHRATALALFASVSDASAAVVPCRDAGCTVIELLDAASLRTARSTLGSIGDDNLRTGQPAALLLELQADSADLLDDHTMVLRSVLNELPVNHTPVITTDLAQRQALWSARKGLYAAVAGTRRPRTTALLEDIAVPAASLTATCGDLQRLFDDHGYDRAVIFGHAKDGNLHFMIEEDFGDSRGIQRYARFTEDLLDLVLGHGGTLKAEHGTGRVMAPFVERQFGSELYDVIRRIKALFDPRGILNPGVIVTEDAQAHLRHLKTVPASEPTIDACVACGFCEPTCPSKDLTLTPRQRIGLHRRWTQALVEGNHLVAQAIEDEFPYDAVDTCAADGLCASSCPLDINTGTLMKSLRAERHGRFTRYGGTLLAGRRAWRLFLACGRWGLRLGHSLGPVPIWLTDLLRRPGGWRVPAWHRDLPRAARHPTRWWRDDDSADVVIFPSCLGSLFDPEPPGLGVGAALQELCARAGFTARTPRGFRGLCCGTPWTSKGYRSGAARMARQTLTALERASRHGRIPIVVSDSSCSLGLRSFDAVLDPQDRRRWERLTIVDAVEFAHDMLAPRLSFTSRWDSVTVHPTCGGEALETGDELVSLAATIAVEAHVPTDWSCCGFAGDRGLLHPELTASATAGEATQVAELGSTVHASSNRTCEIGMQRATGRSYRHIVELMEEASRPTPSTHLDIR